MIETELMEPLPKLNDAEKRLIEKMLNLEKGSPRFAGKGMIDDEKNHDQELEALYKRLETINPEAHSAIERGEDYKGEVKGLTYFDAEKDALLASQQAPKKEGVHIHLSWGNIRYAAAILILCVVGSAYYLFTGIAPDTKQIVSLAGTRSLNTNFGKINVNHHSDVELSSSYLDGNRVNHKNGEALYELKPGQNLVIDTKTFSIILDNSGVVNIFTRNSIERVSPVTGNTIVRGKDGTQYNLSPVEEMRSVNTVAVKVIRAYPSRAGTWTDGFIVLDDMSLLDVVREFELVYNIRFTGDIPDITIDHVYTSVNDSVTAAMETFLPTRYRVSMVREGEYVIEDTQRLKINS